VGVRQSRGATDHPLPNLHGSDVRPEASEARDGVPIVALTEAMVCVHPGERRMHLDVSEPARDDRFGIGRCLAREIRAAFTNEELDKCAGVEIEDQRRCSIT
jgi:hypothetical protein